MFALCRITPTVITFYIKVKISYVHESKYILECSVTVCDEPLHANLGLKTVKNRRAFQKLKWYCIVMCMNDIRLAFKLLSDVWDEVKCKGYPRKSLACPGGFLKETN